MLVSLLGLELRGELEGKSGTNWGGCVGERERGVREERVV